ncbi:U11/U12 small nuclear ribonucleoprotein 35 kDa protein [Oncorhynchus keta]|uniref:U11/U12 small nuclear ribonucleoprotein 35 kDa protein n=1 Tax=Oncorhynchus keta TaxID=8018 RepID=UPI0015FDDB2B|nr:U11/U12 small nuclear ribonucleoprotein 35 kDa protein [Oncorhynchus keta]
MNDWSPVAKVYDPLKAGSIDGTDVEPHDRAVWRAMVARYKPNKAVVGDPLLTLFVARLNPQTTEEKLNEVFSNYGDIRRLRLVRDIVTGFSKGYAFVEYKEEMSVVRARRDANKLVVDQSELFVDFEQERTLKGWVPRRLGGGQGGKKESGQLRFGGKDRPFRKPINLPVTMNQEWGGGSRECERGGEREERYRDGSLSRERETDWGSRGRRDDRDRGRERGVERDYHRERRDRSYERESTRERDDRRGKDDRRHRDDKYRHRDRR